MLIISYDYVIYPDKPDWNDAVKAHHEAWVKHVMDKSGLVEKGRTENPGHIDILCEIPVPA